MEGILRFVRSHTGSQIFRESDSLHLTPKQVFLGILYQSTKHLESCTVMSQSRKGLGACWRMKIGVQQYCESKRKQDHKHGSDTLTHPITYNPNHTKSLARKPFTYLNSIWKTRPGSHLLLKPLNWTRALTP